MNVTKTQINSELKSLGLGIIRYASADPYKNGVAWKPQGKSVKGIWLRSHSPMDMGTGQRDIDVKTAKIVDSLGKLIGGRPIGDGNKFKISENSRSAEYLVLTAIEAPQYQPSRGMDPYYANTYLVPSYVKEKK